LHTVQLLVSIDEHISYQLSSTLNCYLFCSITVLTIWLSELLLYKLHFCKIRKT